MKLSLVADRHAGDDRLVYALHCAGNLFSGQSYLRKYHERYERNDQATKNAGQHTYNSLRLVEYYLNAGYRMTAETFGQGEST